MILTVDFGTSVTKVALWDDDGLVTVARTNIATVHPDLGWAEQEPFSWWTSVVVASAQARASSPDAFAQVSLVVCSAARQTFVPVSAGGDPIGKGLLWSDRRAVSEAAHLTASLGGSDAVRARTGVPVDAGSVAAKIAWLEAHEPDRLRAAAWVLSPRDLVMWRLTGAVVTDQTLASRTGLYDFDGEVVAELAHSAGDRLPPVVASDSVVGPLRPVPAAELGLHAGIPVVIGAGDRQCEVLGAGATLDCPMVSWGTTANVSVPIDVRPDPVPMGSVVSRGALGGWVIEGGLSAAGSFLAWFSDLTGRSVEDLCISAAASPPGARGVVAVSWLDGARAPWWRDDARAGFVGLASAHDVGDLARAVVESVAWDVVRCLRLVTGARAGAPPAAGMTLGGAGARIPLWVDILTGVSGLGAVQRRSGEAASAGAALLGARAVGRNLDLGHLDPVEAEIVPDPESVRQYRALEPYVESIAESLVALHRPPGE